MYVVYVYPKIGDRYHVDSSVSISQLYQRCTAPADPADLRSNGRPETDGGFGGGEEGGGEAAKDEGVAEVGGTRENMDR